MESKDRYIHLSKKKIIKLLDKEQNKTPSEQPKGLWFAKEKKWINFIDKNTSKEVTGNIYLVKLNFPVVKKMKEEDKNKILKIGTQKALDKFIEKYNVNHKIDWMKVSENNAGVLFEPYFYNQQMHPHKYKWYSTLDIPSGCIWNKEAASIELIQEYKKPERKKVRFDFEENKNFNKLLLS